MLDPPDLLDISWIIWINSNYSSKSEQICKTLILLVLSRPEVFWRADSCFGSSTNRSLHLGGQNATLAVFGGISSKEISSPKACLGVEFIQKNQKDSEGGVCVSPPPASGWGDSEGRRASGPSRPSGWPGPPRIWRIWGDWGFLRWHVPDCCHLKETLL